jgi:hypothetical protein
MICEGPAGCGLHVGVRSLVDERPTHGPRLAGLLSRGELAVVVGACAPAGVQLWAAAGAQALAPVGHPPPSHQSIGGGAPSEGWGQRRRGVEARAWSRGVTTEARELLDSRNEPRKEGARSNKSLAAPAPTATAFATAPPAATLEIDR